MHESEIDYIIDGDGRPPAEMPEAVEADTDRAIALLVASEIRDGDCLQIGIGGLPNSVCRALIKAGVREPGISTEMMVDSLA
ncbi:MAG: 4-hydroxybutyrate CoA-transferase, partial [Alphaproteobacteria bacterium]